MNDARKTLDWPLLGAAILILVGLAIGYGRTLDYPFHFDGEDVIKNRISKEPLRLSDFPTKTRSLVDLTWRINWFAGAENPSGYHVVNTLIHYVSALLLLGTAYCALQSSKIPARFRENAGWIAGALALIWALHPIQTQSVTYIVQRYESLMGMFFLASVFCFAIAAYRELKWPWYLGCVAFGFAATLCKEVAVVLPFVLLWYDLAFVRESWITTIRRRWLVYVMLLCSWSIFAQMLFVPKEAYVQGNVIWVQQPKVVSQARGAKQVIEEERIGPWQYLMSQSKAILFYLRLSILPYGQNLDHGWPATRKFSEAILPGLVVVSLLGLTVWAIFKSPSLSFLGGWFFLILAPTSTLIPIKDIVFEHRMYLPLAAVAALVVLAVFEVLWRSKKTEPGTYRTNFAVVVGIVAFVLLVVTYNRNQVYESKVALWTDVTLKAPGNFRGFHNLGRTHYEQGSADLAVPRYQRAIELNPANTGSYITLGRILRRSHPEVAERLFAKAVELDPTYSEAHNNYGAMISRDDPQKAANHFRRAIQLKPDNVEAYVNLGNALARQKKYDEAIFSYSQALKIDPQFDLAAQNRKEVLRIRDEAKVSN